jgi:hypothetical protein
MLSAITERMTGTIRLVVEIFNRLVILICGLCMVGFGWQNFLHGFGSFRMRSLTPLAWWPSKASLSPRCIGDIPWFR